jgi:hypothetical protein
MWRINWHTCIVEDKALRYGFHNGNITSVVARLWRLLKSKCRIISSMITGTGTVHIEDSNNTGIRISRTDCAVSISASEYDPDPVYCK